MDFVTELTIFVLAAFVGFAVISKVPTTLHTPLMSQTNAIHGIVMLGGLIVAGFARRLPREPDRLHRDRLRRDQHRRRVHGHRPDAGHVRPQAQEGRGRRGAEAVNLAVIEPGGDLSVLLYIVSFSLFIYGLMQGTHPTTAKTGNLIAAGGMAVAVITTLLLDGIGNWGVIIGALVVGSAGGPDRLDARADDADAADGRALQRRRRRRRGADRLVGAPPRDRRDQLLPGLRDPARRADPDPVLRRRSARSPSGARTSPSPSSRT